jgi:hypothetical protein
VALSRPQDQDSVTGRVFIVDEIAIMMSLTAQCQVDVDVTSITYSYWRQGMIVDPTLVDRKHRVSLTADSEKVEDIATVTELFSLSVDDLN